MRLWLTLPWILVVACAEGESAEPANRSRGADVRSSDEQAEDRGGVEVADAATPRRAAPKSSDAGQAPAQSSAGGARDAGAAGNAARDAGAAKPRAAQDAGPRDASQDAGTQDSGTEPTPANTGSCCAAGDGPGCGDSALQACVCALSPRCCSETWDESCARLVREKNCQSGVRDCVCGNAEGQWQQAYCCEGGWNATCESVSIHKCGATAACP